VDLDELFLEADLQEDVEDFFFQLFFLLKVTRVQATLLLHHHHYRPLSDGKVAVAVAMAVAVAVAESSFLCDEWHGLLTVSPPGHVPCFLGWW
jgi:uncharacterized membrane protein YwaF